MFGVLNEFIYGAIWLAMVIALGFTGWRATNQGVFRAVAESYYGRKAQLLGGACLLIAVVAGIFFVVRVLQIVAFGLRSGAGLFFLLGAALGGYLSYRYYVRAV
jgi:hypothetical protein